MLSVEIYFDDLVLEKQDEIMALYDTSPEDENWDIVPLAIIEREDEEGKYEERKVD